jgi:hypothetical protein
MVSVEEVETVGKRRIKEERKEEKNVGKWNK